MFTEKEKKKLEKLAEKRGGYILYRMCGTPVFVNRYDEDYTIYGRDTIEYLFGEKGFKKIFES